MSLISVDGLTFGYDGSYENIFEDVSFRIDTEWKIGLIGRNGKGKTTFLTRSGKNSPTSTSGEMNCQKKLLTNYCINGTIIQAIKGVWQVYE